MNRNNGNKNAIEGIAFSIFGILFMVYWIYTAAKGGAYVVAFLFGGFGLLSMLRNLVYQCRALKNSKNSRDGHYGEYDGGYGRADYSEDPWDVSYPAQTGQYGTDVYGNPINTSGGKNFCPYCGIPISADHMFCKNCGRQLPD